MSEKLLTKRTVAPISDKNNKGGNEREFLMIMLRFSLKSFLTPR